MMIFWELSGADTELGCIKELRRQGYLGIPGIRPLAETCVPTRVGRGIDYAMTYYEGLLRRLAES